MSKNIQNRFYFSKTKRFMFQRVISEHMQTPAFQCAIPEKTNISQICVPPLSWKFQGKKPRPMEIAHYFFLITASSFTFLFN